MRRLGAGAQALELDPERVKRAEKQFVDMTQLFKDMATTRVDLFFWAEQLAGVKSDLLGELEEAQYLGQDSHGSLLIPHWGPPAESGRFIVHGIKVRRLDGSKTSVSGSQYSRCLYDVSRGGFPSNTVAVITEGESDCWAIEPHMSQDVSVYSLPSGSSLWRADWLPSLEQFETIYTAFDNDRAGQQATEKVRSSIGWGRWKELAVPTLFNDVREAISKGWEPKL
jgi:hypothetical protein